jgi:hypothetical protein
LVPQDGDEMTDELQARSRGRKAEHLAEPKIGFGKDERLSQVTV